jgi:hypothetical protein
VLGSARDLGNGDNALFLRTIIPYNRLRCYLSSPSIPVPLGPSQPQISLIISHEPLHTSPPLCPAWFSKLLQGQGRVRPSNSRRVKELKDFLPMRC